MIDENIIKKQIDNTLKEFDKPELGKRYKGKVRDTYADDESLFIFVSDRLSAFDRVLTTIPFKGQVLNQISNYWFDETKDIIKNHIIAVPDPNVMVCKKVKILPIEVVIRGYLTGSAWRDYEKGNPVSGIKLPEGLKKDQKFDSPLFTPSTKEDEGHDIPISKEEIVEKGMLTQELADQVEEKALELFEKGTQLCNDRGLILVDTKYEFGLNEDNELVLADEIHTPDSSRFWYKNEYEERFNAGKDQKMLDKEYLRQWLINEKNFMGDGEIPEIPEEIKVEVAKRYIKAYEEITGKDFVATNEPITERILNNLEKGNFL